MDQGFQRVYFNVLFNDLYNYSLSQREGKLLTIVFVALPARSHFPCNFEEIILHIIQTYGKGKCLYKIMFSLSQLGGAKRWLRLL